MAINGYIVDLLRYQRICSLIPQMLVLIPHIIAVTPNIEINSGVAVTVGAGKTMIIDILQIGDL